MAICKELEFFDKMRKCDACGKKSDLWARSEYIPPRYLDDTPLIRRTCCHCKYSWYEKPLFLKEQSTN